MTSFGTIPKHINHSNRIVYMFQQYQPGIRLKHVLSSKLLFVVLPGRKYVSKTGTFWVSGTFVVPFHINSTGHIELFYIHGNSKWYVLHIHQENN